MRRALVVAMVASVASMGAMATPAMAAKYETEVVLQGAAFPEKDTIIFYGTVDSPKGKCFKRRSIEVFADGADEPAGRARSQGDGRWALYRGIVNAGYYYARAPRTKVGDDTCKADRSPTVLIA